MPPISHFSKDEIAERWAASIRRNEQETDELREQLERLMNETQHNGVTVRPMTDGHQLKDGERAIRWEDDGELYLVSGATSDLAAVECLAAHCDIDGHESFRATCCENGGEFIVERAPRYFASRAR